MSRIAVLIFLCVIVPPLPLLAQTETVTPPPFDLSRDISGTIDAGARLPYHFEVPQDQDVVITLSADKVVSLDYCVQVITGANTVKDCPVGGGGGSDSPVTQSFFFPTDDDPATVRTVDMTLIRPSSLTGSAHFQVHADFVTPQTQTLGSPLDAAPTADAPFQSYTIEADPTQPFSVTAASSNDDSFLWAAFEPYKLLPRLCFRRPIPRRALS